jgi:hypothetical protein
MFMDYKHLFKIELCFKGKKYERLYGSELNLVKGQPILLGFDQSTSQTGMCAKTSDGRLICLVDFINKGLPDNYIYQAMLKQTLKKMLAGCIVKLVVIEKPWGGKKYSFGKLTELKGFMKQLKYEIPEFSQIEIEDIYPQSWRSAFLVSQDYTGRFGKNEVKDAVREEVCIRETQLRDYAYSKVRVPDSIEAYGILDGYIKKNFAENGLRIVNKSMKDNKNLKVEWELTCANLVDLKKEFGEKDKIFKAVIGSCGNANIYRREGEAGCCLMKYNEELTEEENMRIACSNTKGVVLLPVPFSKIYCSFVWELGRPMQAGEFFFLVGIRRSIK